MASVVEPMTARCLLGLEIVLFVRNTRVIAKNFVICNEKLKSQVSVETARKTARVVFVSFMGLGAFKRVKGGKLLASFIELLARLIFGACC